MPLHKKDNGIVISLNRDATHYKKQIRLHPNATNALLISVRSANDVSGHASASRDMIKSHIIITGIW